jgi:hypothetical protein
MPSLSTLLGGGATPQASGGQVNAATNPTITGARNWWLVKQADGSLELVKATVPPAGRSMFIGAASSLNDLQTHLGGKLTHALGTIGASALQQSTLISVLDTAAGKNASTTRITVAANPVPGTNTGATANDANGNPVSTVPSGDAAAAGLSLDLGLSGWGAFAIRALEGLAGAALILLGLQALTGGSGNPAQAVSKATRGVTRRAI